MSNPKSLQTRYHKPITLTDEVGRGGEATVYTVAERPHEVAKCYHQPTNERLAKLKAMLAYPPSQPPTHNAIVWPTELLYANREFVGFLMPNMLSDSVMQASEPIFNHYNPARRKQRYPGFNWRYLHRTALNLVIAVNGVHRQGHVVGDINESNILVSPQALVTLIDTDSFQISDHAGQIYRCPVGKPEYTPPELQGVSFRTVDQTQAHDNFGLAVLIFQLLMEGYHPFTGRLLSDMSVGRVDLHNIQQGIFPYADNESVDPPPHAPPLTNLFPTLQAMFNQAFVVGHSQPEQRPSTNAWITALEEAENHLITCAVEPSHVYSDHLSQCPWCATMPLAQRALPAIGTPIDTKSVVITKEKPLANHRPPIIEKPGNIKILMEEELLLWHFREPLFPSFLFIGVSMGIFFAAWQLAKLALASTFVSVALLFNFACCILPGLFVGYLGLMWLINRTELTVTPETIKLKCGPLPGDEISQTLATEDIVQLYTRKKEDGSKESGSRFQLYVVKKDGSQGYLWRNDSYAAVRFMEQTLEEFLDIPDEPVEGEYIPEKKGNSATA